MVATPYLVQVPSQDSQPIRSLRDGVSAMAIMAGSSADATAMAKASVDGDSDPLWALADVTAIAAPADMNGWALRLKIVSPEGVDVFDATVEADGVNTAFVAATGTLTGDGTVVADTQTVTIGANVYTFQDTLTNVAGHVKIGGSAAATLTNLFHAINASGGVAGTDYAAATVAHPTVVATNPSGTTVMLTAITAGTAGNLIATTETSTHLSFGAVTLTGGIGAADAMSSLGLKMVAALNADALIAGASWTQGSGTLKVAETTDSLGDHRVFAYVIPKDADRTQLKGVAGMVGTVTDNGVAGAALTVVLAADTYAVPKLYGLLGAGA